MAPARELCADPPFRDVAFPQLFPPGLLALAEASKERGQALQDKNRNLSAPQIPLRREAPLEPNGGPMLGGAGSNLSCGSQGERKHTCSVRS